MTTTNPVSIIRLCQGRGVSFAVVDGADGQAGLKVLGPAEVVAVLKPHIVAAKSAIIAWLIENQQPNPNPVANPQGGKGDLSQANQPSRPTPLAILAASQFKPGQQFQQGRAHRPLTADEIELALWLTAAAADVASDITLSQRSDNNDHGNLIDAATGVTYPVVQTIQALAAGPQANEPPPSWLTRVQSFQVLMESTTANVVKWRSLEYLSSDWPAELRRAKPPPTTTTKPTPTPTTVAIGKVS